MKNVAVISLGCDKNRIDTEHLLYSVSQGGYAVCDIADAEIIVVNTCAFIESARQESIDTILQCAELKKTGKCKRLVVTGCLPQKYRAELQAELPEVDAFLGTFEYDRILAAVEGNNAETAAVDFCTAENGKRLLTTFPHVAYLKIAEGCDNKCTFCTIPSIRGGYRSRSVDDIAAEARSLARDGVKEIILVAQDVTRYGCDIESSLMTLLCELEKIPGVKYRLLYCYPERVTDELIRKISDSSAFVKYIDIPVQHFSDRVLKLMNRRTTGEQVEALINKLHARGITVRTTLMVGFPGETEEDFSALTAFVSRAKPEYAGVFAYSKEKDTPSARLPGHIKAAEKRRRVNALGSVCTAVTREFNAGFCGKTLEVLYEDADYERNMFMGRAEFQAPDVDGRVYFTSKTPVDVGNTYRVRITRTDDYDLFGEAE